MADDFLVIRFPELVFGIAGPIGVDIEAITASLAESLHGVGYKSKVIRITDEIENIPSSAKSLLEKTTTHK